MNVTPWIALAGILVTSCTGEAVVCNEELVAGSACVTATAEVIPSATATPTVAPTQTPWVIEITQTPTITLTASATPVIVPTATSVSITVQRGDTWHNRYEEGRYIAAGLYAQTCYPSSTPPPEPPVRLVPELPPLHTGDVLLVPCHLWSQP